MKRTFTCSNKVHTPDCKSTYSREEGHKEIKRLQGLPGKSASYTGKTG